MSICKDFEKIEKRIDTKKWICGDFNLWPLMRLEVYNYLLIKNTKYLNVPKSKLKVIDKIGRVLFGIKSLFRSYNYIVFSDITERKVVDGIYFDKSVDFISESLKSDGVLHVESLSASRFHYSLHVLPNRNFLSGSFLALLSRIYVLTLSPHKHELEKFFKKSRELKILESTLGSDQSFREKLMASCLYSIGCYRIFKFLFKIYKPKAIFVNRRGVNEIIFKAANDLGIKTIEIAHGVISKNHISYNSCCHNISTENFPEYLFSFGVDAQKELKKNGIIKKIIPVGSYYIDHIKDTNKQSENILNLKKKYTKVVCVSLEWTVESKLIPFLIHAAKRNPSKFFALIPRNIDTVYEYDFLPNIKILNEELSNGETIYEILNSSDIHLTVYSTCAIESLALGVPNILVNIDNLSTEHLGWIVDDETTWLVNSIDELDVALLGAVNTEKSNVLKKGNYFLEPHYKKNIQKALKVIVRP